MECICMFVMVNLVSLSVGNEQPFVAWFMDNHTETKLYPSFNNNSRWIGDLKTISVNRTSQDLFVSGVTGDAIYILNKPLQLARNLTTSDCVASPGSCTGLVVTFWINLRSWQHDSSQNILCVASGDSNSIAGAVQMSIENNSLSFCIMYENGNKLHCILSSIGLTTIQHKWTFIALMWDATQNESKIFMNDTDYTVAMWEKPFTVRNIEDFKAPCIGNFEMGSQDGPPFYLDSLKVFYYMGGSSKFIPTLFLSEPATTTVIEKKPIYPILLATLLPLALVIVVAVICWYFFRIRRTKNSFRSYIRQTSTKIPDHSDHQDVYSDAGDEHTDLDSEGELEKLHNRLINRV